MTDHKNLPEALAAFQGEMPVVPKNRTAGKGSYSYKYADLADVMGTVAPLLAKHGLSFTTLPGRTETGAGTITGRLMHTSGEAVEASLPLTGDTPQALGSSITYMRRYLLGCMTGVATDEDEDGQLAQQTPQRQQARKPQPPQPLTDGSKDWIESMMRERDILDPADQMRGIEKVVGRPVAGWDDLHEDDADQIIAQLNRVPVRGAEA